jgi:hypothetical protein
VEFGVGGKHGQPSPDIAALLSPTIALCVIWPAGNRAANGKGRNVSTEGRRKDLELYLPFSPAGRFGSALLFMPEKPHIFAAISIL